MKKAIGYIRVSKEEANKISPAQQRESIVSFCKSQNWKLIEVLEDNGKSGKDLKRPSLQKLLKEADKKRFDVLVVW